MTETPHLDTVAGDVIVVDADEPQAETGCGREQRTDELTDVPPRRRGRDVKQSHMMGVGADEVLSRVRPGRIVGFPLLTAT